MVIFHNLPLTHASEFTSLAPYLSVIHVKCSFSSVVPESKRVLIHNLQLAEDKLSLKIWLLNSNLNTFLKLKLKTK